MKSTKDKFIVTAILFILAVFIVRSSFALFRGSLATSSAANIAEWNVTLEQSGVNNNLQVIPGLATATYTLNVKSLSDVDIKYDVVLTNLPSGIEASIDGTNFTLANNGTVTFTNVGTIPYNSNDGIDTKTITLRGVNGATPVNNQTVTINVVAKQIIGS